MRNLRSTSWRSFESPQSHTLSASGWDVETGSIICAFGPTKDNTLLQLKRWHPNLNDKASALIDIASWDAPCPLPDLECDSILNVHHFPDSSTISLVLASGDIYVVREHPAHEEEKIEIVGSVDVGISAVTWSPDDELVAIVTRADTLLYMTRDFDNASTATLTQHDLQASKHVSVGWGRKETQFKGKGAKALRDPTMPERVDEGLQSAHDDQSTTISWRGDGAYVAVNSTQASPRRLIRVYSREGVLDGVSEPVDGLEGALSWRPAGNLLAGIQRFDDHVDVVFFERNGLRHGQFSLRLSVADMDDWAASISLKWSADSSVLAVSLKDRVQLWTMGNYHWYLKQELFVSKGEIGDKSLDFKWHPEQPLVCSVGSPQNLYLSEFVSHVETGPTMSQEDYGVVSVIDGQEVKLTPFRIANIPPPMALHDIKVKCSVIDTAVYGGGSKTKIAVLERSTLSLYAWNLKMKPVLPPSLVASTQLQVSGIFQQIAFVGETQVLLLANDGEKSSIQVFTLVSSELEKIGVFSIPSAQGILCRRSSLAVTPYLHFSPTSRLATHLALVDPKGHRMSDDWSDLMVFPKQVQHIKIVNISPNISTQLSNGPSGGDIQTVAFGLASNGALFANGRRLTADCTSFLVTPAHLVFTTTQHLLKFVHMAIVEELEVPPNTPEADERCRSIERGARLITIMPSISALVLQMPRGNLETIYPRALVLAGVRQNINDKKYKKAFLLCRSHRVDMNILHDHDPDAFIKDVSSFIDQVEKIEHVDLFLSQLREEDVSKTMYIDTVGRGERHVEAVDLVYAQTLPQRIGKSKVNSICDAFLGALQRRASTHVQNIVTSHVCKSPPDLDGGLLEVAKLQKNNPEKAEKAVEHICFLADVNRLYDNALGLYDLDLTLLMAQQSQKDPREYLPFLQKLQELPPPRKRFTIDDYLGRYSKALESLHVLNDFEEFKLYMIKHTLYDDALHLYRYKEDSLKAVMTLYAGYLMGESRYKEAGIAFEYVHEYKSASEAYRLAHLWREALSCATTIPFSRDRLQSFANAIAASQQELKDYHSAAIIYQDYLQDVESAARLYCKGYFFADAIRILSLNNCADDLETIVDTGLVESMGTMTELLAECKAQINAQVPRLRELRIKKVEAPWDFYDGDVNDGADIPDNVSLAATDASTTGGSLFTRYTNRTGTVGTNATRKTSKNKRREERKRARGKKGSVYEEEYLVNSIGRLINRVNAVGEEVERLVIGLMRRGMRERAKAVEGAMVEVVAMCKECIEEVFLVEEKGVNGEEKVVNENVNRGDGAVWDNAEIAQAKREVPVVKEFEKLSLLSG